MKNDPWLRRKQLFSQSGLDAGSKRKANKKWKVLPILWLAFKKTSTVIGAMVIISAVFMAWALSSVMSTLEQSAAINNAALPSEMVLLFDIDGDIGDLPKEASFSDPFSTNSRMLRNYVDALEKAGDDNRVKGIYARLNYGGLSVTHVQELRKALADFRAKGKFAYIYASAFDQGIGAYYLASAFDERWMQPMGVVMISGINAEMPYLRNVLDKIGVSPQIYKRKEYKSAYDMFTEKQMSEASRQEMGELVSDISVFLKDDIAADMGISGDKFKALVDKGLFMDHEAVKAGLIDVLDYEDTLIEKINKDVTGDPKSDTLSYIDLGTYVDDMVKKRASVGFGAVNMSAKKAPKIALVYAVGAIVDSAGTKASVGIGNNVAAADLIAPALLEIADDDSYDAVVLRVDSPGGSPVASETILRAVQKVQESGKLLIVSMGAAAASGGYWISCAADQIFVLPSTITGSIGVLGGKFSMEQLWEKLGVNWDSVSWGDNAAMWSMNQPYSKSEAERVNAMMDNVYSNFISRVAKGRNMSEAEVEKIARGRVWSGKKAIKVGLADKIGGLNDALDYAAVQLGNKSRHDVFVEVVPKPLTPLEQILKLLDNQVKAGEALQIQAALIKSIMPEMKDILIQADMQQGNAVVYDPVVTRIKDR